MVNHRSILLGVTADTSFILMRGLPEYLRDSGWDVHVVSSPGPVLEGLGTVPGITSHVIMMERRPSPLSDLKSLVSWVRLLRKVRPDVTSVGTPKAGLLGGIAAAMTGVPRRIYILRGLRLETSTGLTRRILIVLEKLSMRSAHDVVAVSKSLRTRAVALRLLKAHKIRVLGEGSSNGVDIDAYSVDEVDPDLLPTLRQELEIVPNVPVIGFVGRLNSDKGLSVLSEARKILESRGVDHQMLIVGGIDEGESTELLNSIRSTGRGAIETGHETDPRPYYCLMDLLCLPTLREGFPNVVLEAGALGLPTVTTDATGAIDSVLDGITGRIAKAGNAESLADQIQAVLDASPYERAQMGAAARHRVEIHYSRHQVLKAYGAYYARDLSAAPAD